MNRVLPFITKMVVLPTLILLMLNSIYFFNLLWLFWLLLDLHQRPSLINHKRAMHINVACSVRASSLNTSQSYSVKSRFEELGYYCHLVFYQIGHLIHKRLQAICHLFLSPSTTCFILEQIWSISNFNWSIDFVVAKGMSCIGDL